MRMNNGIYPGPITPEEIERVKKLRDSGAAPAAPAVLRTGERLNSREVKAMYTMGGARLLMESPEMDGLKKRLQKLRLWWRFRGAVRAVQTCFDRVLDDGEPEQNRAMKLRYRHMIASVHENKREDPEGLTTWVHIKDLNLVIRRVLEDTCDMCMLNEEEATACPLRKALKSMTTLSALDTRPGKNGCLFRGLTVMEQIENDEGLGIRD